MNKKLKFTALLLGTCMTAMTGMALAGCGEDNPTPPPAAKKITDGIFDGSIETNTGFIRFHEKDEVVEGKSIFYAQFVSNAVAGYYTVQEKDYDYTGSWASKDDYNSYCPTGSTPDPSKALSGTAKYTVTLTSFADEQYGVFGYEDGKLYNFNLDHEYASTGFSAGYVYNQKDDNGQDEIGVTLYRFVNTADEDRSFAIKHDGSYSDDVSQSHAVNGTWKLSGTTYTLTPDDSDDKGGTFVVGADKLTGTLTVDGKEYSLGQPKPVGKPFMTFSGEKMTDIDVGYGMKADMWASSELLSNLDMSLTITSELKTADAKPTDLTLNGTYTVDENGTPKTFAVSGEQKVQNPTDGSITIVPVNIEGTFTKSAQGVVSFGFTYNNIKFDLTGKYAERTYVTFSGEKKDVDMGYGMKADFTVEAKLLDDLTMTLIQTSIMTISGNEVKTPLELKGTYTLDANGAPATFAVSGKTAVQDPTSGEITMQDVNVKGTFTANGSSITMAYISNNISFTATGTYAKQATGIIFSLETKTDVPQLGEQDVTYKVILFDDETAIMIADYQLAYIPDQVFIGSYEMGEQMPSSVTVSILGVDYTGTVAMAYPNLNLTFNIAALGGELVLAYALPAQA